MALKKTATANTGTTEVVKAQLPNLGQLIEAFELALTGALTVTQEIEDTVLDVELRDGLAALAAKIGFDGYDPNGCSFVFVVTEQGNRYLARPSVYAYENGCCIRWGEKRFSLDGELNSDLFAFVPGEDPLLLLDPMGYCLPCPVKLDSSYRTEAARKELPTKLATCRTAEALSPYLLRGEPRVAWKDVSDTAVIEFYQVQWSPARNNPEKMNGSVLGTLDGESVLFWAPGDQEGWKNIPLNRAIADEPIAVTKSGKNITVGEVVLELKGGNFAKLKDLKLGEYKVIHYSSELASYEGRTWTDYKITVLVDGVPTIASGNAYIKDLLSKTNPVITADKPATLHIDDKKVAKDGTTKVVCRLIPDGAGDSPLLARLKARQQTRLAEPHEVPPAL